MSGSTYRDVGVKFICLNPTIHTIERNGTIKQLIQNSMNHSDSGKWY